MNHDHAAPAGSRLAADRDWTPSSLLSRVSIRAKLFITVTLSTGFALLVAGLLFVAYDWLQYSQQKLQDATVEAQLLSATTSAALIFDDGKSAGEYLAMFDAVPDMTAVVIYDKQGKVFAAHLRGAKSRYAPPAVEGPTHRFKDDHLLLFYPVHDGSEQIGTVFLDIDTGRTQRTVSYAGVVLMLSLGAMLAALLLIARLQTMIVTPLLEVTATARLIVSNRDYSRRVVKRGADEVGVLVDAFNQMMDQIEQRKVALEDANAALQSKMEEHQAARAEIAALNRDLERRVAERTAELETATRAKSTFLATMSHEIRTPMNGVLGMLELLSLSPLDEDQQSTVEVVRESGRSLLRIIDDILDFSKMEAGKLEIRAEVASMTDVVYRVFGIYSGNASAKGLVLKPAVDARISPALWVDPVRLQQILNNFVSNAIKFTERGEIEIRAELIGRDDKRETVRFSIKDTGIGISEETQKRLFQPFVQADASTSRQYGGSGLGLSICMRLAEMLGGLVSIESKPGRGTTIVLTLTMTIADADALTKKASKSITSQLRLNTRPAAPTVAEAERDGTLVLLVDDHPINAMVIMRQLNTLGYAAESAENGLLAFEKWKSGRYALVVTDCNMPEMSGYELARAVRVYEKEHGLKRIPVVACTANALAEEAGICFEAGMDDYIPKPVNLDALLEKLDIWLPIASVPESESGPQSPLDTATLESVTGGDATIEKELIAMFRSINDEDVAALKQAVATQSKVGVAHFTHRIKGAARTVGALKLAEVCENVETANYNDDWPAVRAFMARFGHELQRLIEHLETR